MRALTSTQSLLARKRRRLRNDEVPLEDAVARKDEKGRTEQSFVDSSTANVKCKNRKHQAALTIQVEGHDIDLNHTLAHEYVRCPISSSTTSWTRLWPVQRNQEKLPQGAVLSRLRFNLDALRAFRRYGTCSIYFLHTVFCLFLARHSHPH
ncbi:hypothetical protein VTL71DRAFT_12592 [Oculimacula yallundae]|uniref:Uncharacterized protein n=1 Tax=Oculimacula yallundae TaxID=86028 RepID=A0ABR4CP81_9HELO